ncbi:unnamed protein product [Peronospora belbahrii]|uniref:C2H2-type domain-containing protein n=1 Tax=Peronospora belbahrii TaxID=622444 RepID=A0AAU9KUX4_9STRA|nr:unnamed protein product [Peronospora belbahrii]CAH0515582.1 unnamed protein product [Peronospora belbahrii]
MQARLNEPSPTDGGSDIMASLPAKLRRTPQSDERPFVCPIPSCSGRFRRKYTLREHIKTHTGEQPYECPIESCGRRFSTSGNLARHRKLHAIYKYQCPVVQCSREFKSREKLQRHLKTHTTDLPNTCGRTFSTGGNFSQHLQERRNHPPNYIRGNRVDIARQPPILKSLPVHEQQKCRFPMQERPNWLIQSPVVPSAMLFKERRWSAAPMQDAVIAAQSRPEHTRISDQDVQDILDCLFADNPAVQSVSKMSSRIWNEPAFLGANHLYG